MNSWAKVRLCAYAFMLLSAATLRAQTRGGWERVEQCNPGRDPAPSINYLQFFDSKRGLMAGNAGFICYTRNGGTTWHRPTLPASLSGPVVQFGEDFVSGSRNMSGRRANTIHLVTEHHLLRSRDKGLTWEAMKQPFNPGRLSYLHGPGSIVEYYDVAFADEDEGWVLCGILKRVNKEERFLQSYILYTDDGGETWKETPMGPRGLLMVRMHFADKDRGWVVGEKGTILHTENGGANWEEQHYLLPEDAKRLDARPKLLDLHFKGKERGLIVGRFGTILKTEDGGRHWSYIRPRDNQGRAELLDLIRVQVIDEDHALVVGQGGAIYNTDDGGQTWSRQEGMTRENLYAISMQDRKHGWAAGGKRTVLRYDADDDSFDNRQDNREDPSGSKKGSKTRRGCNE